MPPRTRNKSRPTPRPQSGVPQEAQEGIDGPLSLNCRLASLAEPPLFQINLSAPPRSRHRAICLAYSRQIHEFVKVYDEILALTPFPRVLKALAKHLMNKVHSKEETEEMEGISEITGVPLHLVVAFNTFLDLFSGCISGGVKVKDAGEDAKSTGIVHFRNLDWGMEALRKMMISVEFVRNGVVVARAVTYAGYVGVLTGVRRGLSISLNYRSSVIAASHGNSPPPKFTKFHTKLHQMGLILGFRPSISSYLRHLLLSPDPPPSLTSLAETLPSRPSSPCYLTFCSPEGVLVLEKDFTTAVVQTSDQFLTVTNHDRMMEAMGNETFKQFIEQERKAIDVGLLHDVLEDSRDRKERMTELFKAARPATITSRTVRDWIEAYPIANECTHFSCIMDPSVEGGGLVWVRAYIEPHEPEGDFLR
ncbi:hypothetical protein BDN72DRAFT_879494 [Pluteus cervinus]|uniref:Uncharacterized protein n=1 Tax=Pluteus cervinus TaxID=181527 RepID=A0ACD3AQ11_9AGAR|nr:hypothetical protein BDN72DRAFT_879494 [Pluteus cervinus]